MGSASWWAGSYWRSGFETDLRIGPAMLPDQLPLFLLLAVVRGIAFEGHHGGYGHISHGYGHDDHHKGYGHKSHGYGHDDHKGYGHKSHHGYGHHEHYDEYVYHH